MSSILSWLEITLKALRRCHKLTTKEIELSDVLGSGPAVVLSAAQSAAQLSGTNCELVQVRLLWSVIRAEQRAVPSLTCLIMELVVRLLMLE